MSDMIKVECELCGKVIAEVTQSDPIAGLLLLDDHLNTHAGYER